MSQATAIAAMAVQGRIVDEKSAELQGAVAIRGAFVGAPDPVAIAADLTAARTAFYTALYERNNLGTYTP